MSLYLQFSAKCISTSSLVSSPGVLLQRVARGEQPAWSSNPDWGPATGQVMEKNAHVTH